MHDWYLYNSATVVNAAASLAAWVAVYTNLVTPPLSLHSQGWWPLRVTSVQHSTLDFLAILNTTSASTCTLFCINVNLNTLIHLKQEVQVLKYMNWDTAILSARKRITTFAKVSQYSFNIQRVKENFVLFGLSLSWTIIMSFLPDKSVCYSDTS